MRRIIYLSAGRGAMAPEVVDDILTVSRRNNAR
ncbi:MAG: blue light sensor protein, partial [Rhodobacteraceae bacterium]